jgi:hypothetical protein
MPTVLKIDGFRLFFYSDEGNEPVHIHVQYQSATAKFWITSEVIVANNFGMRASDLSKAAKIVEKNKSLIKDKWNEYFRI